MLDFGATGYHAIGFNLSVNGVVHTAFSALVHVFGPGGVELTNSPLTYNGSNALNPIFIGFQSTMTDIEKFSIFPTFNSGAAQHDWIIGHVILDSSSVVSNGAPEPGSFALTLLGAAAVLGYARKRHARSL